MHGVLSSDFEGHYKQPVCGKNGKKIMRLTLQSATPIRKYKNVSKEHRQLEQVSNARVNTKFRVTLAHTVLVVNHLKPNSKRHSCVLLGYGCT